MKRLLIAPLALALLPATSQARSHVSFGFGLSFGSAYVGVDHGYYGRGYYDRGYYDRGYYGRPYSYGYVAAPIYVDPAPVYVAPAPVYVAPPVCAPPVYVSPAPYSGYQYYPARTYYYPATGYYGGYYSR